MRILGLILAMVAVAAPAMAQDWKAHPDDTTFSQEALTQRLSGQTLVYYDDGQSVFETDGKYNYTYGGGGTWYGYWAVKENSVVCVTFVTGVERCDRFVENGGRLILQTEDGLRFPIR
ncbi:MAG: hypothetical protein ACU0A6_08980 [Shimia sp.]|jgi:hypothetical protein|uniref:hypothetical protein n=1 Tax=Shimia sp. TaxID=1954381 RepID=UPI00405A14C2